jgi:hypothetical protein
MTAALPSVGSFIKIGWNGAKVHAVADGVEGGWPVTVCGQAADECFYRSDGPVTCKRCHREDRPVGALDPKFEGTVLVRADQLEVGMRFAFYTFDRPAHTVGETSVHGRVHVYSQGRRLEHWYAPHDLVRIEHDPSDVSGPGAIHACYLSHDD